MYRKKNRLKCVNQSWCKRKKNIKFSVFSRRKNDNANGDGSKKEFLEICIPVGLYSRKMKLKLAISENVKRVAGCNIWDEFRGVRSMHVGWGRVDMWIRWGGNHTRTQDDLYGEVRTKEICLFTKNLKICKTIDSIGLILHNKYNKIVCSEKINTVLKVSLSKWVEFYFIFWFDIHTRIFLRGTELVKKNCISRNEFHVLIF